MGPKYDEGSAVPHCVTACVNAFPPARCLGLRAPKPSITWADRPLALPPRVHCKKKKKKIS